MGEAAVRVRAAGWSDLADVEDLLAANGLPAGDVRDHPEAFVVATLDGACVAAGGLEVHGARGLLRSVVVGAPHRGRGCGTAVCDALADRARAADVETLYLLTTTAGAFFRARGYERVDRAAVPEEIRATAQFAELCPDSATVMRRPVG